MHTDIQPKSTQTLQSELDAGKKLYATCESDKKRLDKELDEARRNLEKASTDITSGYSNKQELLDKNITCMEENKALLKQISRFKVLLQEKKDAQWRLERANNYLTSFFAAERMNDQLYIVKGRRCSEDNHSPEGPLSFSFQCLADAQGGIHY